MTLPNLVIAGAPKCGTSSLFNWLVDHPDVCGSSVKEPFFLMDEDHPLRRKACNFHDHGLDAYATAFANCSPDAKIVVEATTHYIYQGTAREVLANLPTKPRVLFVLRKPSERLFSSFAYSKNNLANVRSGLSFAEFIRLIRDSSDANVLTEQFGPSAYVLARELRYSDYASYLLKWRDAVGAERMRIILFESLRANPKREIQALCTWLGIDPAYYDDYAFAARNRTVAVRSQGIQRIARSLSAKIPLGSIRNSLKHFYLTLQSRGFSGARTAEDEAVLAELDEEFRDTNAKLSREFDLNLDAWN